jgi:hypothetical protein
MSMGAIIPGAHCTTLPLWGRRPRQTSVLRQERRYLGLRFWPDISYAHLATALGYCKTAQRFRWTVPLIDAVPCYDGGCCSDQIPQVGGATRAIIILARQNRLLAIPAWSRAPTCPIASQN